MIFPAPTLTRNWFRSSDIAAALLVCLVERRRTDSLWWYDELVESFEFVLLDRVLLEAWLLCGTLGLYPSSREPLLVLDAILLRPRGPLFAISIIAHNRVPCILGGTSNRTGILGYYDRAVLAKNILAMSWAAIREPACDPAISDIAERHFSALGLMDVTRVESTLLAIQYMLYGSCNSQNNENMDLCEKFSCISLEPKRDCNEYPKSRREWIKKCPQLPNEIAYFMDQSVSLISDISHVYNPFHNFRATLLRGSIYWDKQLEEYGLGEVGSEQIDDDETEEVFQDFITEYAADDIPDEWSSEDRNKLRILNTAADSFPDWKTWLIKYLPNEFLENAFGKIEEGKGIYSYREHSIELGDEDKKYIRPLIIRSSYINK